LPFQDAAPTPAGDWRHIEQLLTEMQNLLHPELADARD
jgi:hypothetical protein